VSELLARPVNWALEPVIVEETESDPVILDDPSEKNPFFILNSFAISFPYPRVC
jgi:hypothetical protein